MKKIWFYDIEVLSNFFSATFKEKDSKIVKTFVIHNLQNDFKELMHFLGDEVRALIGYNNLNYDYPVIHWMIDHIKLLDDRQGEAIVKHIYTASQGIINSEYSEIRKPYIIQRDLYRVCHFDNKAKMTSLKALEIAMRMDNVEDMPIAHTSKVKTRKEIDEIVAYNLHDVNATELFYYKIIDKLKMRRDLSIKYKLDLMNANDPKIGESIFVKILAKELKISEWELRNLSTPRSKIRFKDCILPKIKFNNKEFNELLDDWMGTSITETKNSISNSVIYKGFKYDYGTGGIHGCIKPGVYNSDDKYTIIDIDVASFYPNLAISNNLFPEHLGEAFCRVYKDIYSTRAKAKKEGDKTVNEGLKLALNGVYGKSNDEHSPFYDPKFTMQITLNGQLLLSMLAESIVDNISDCTMLQVNTDGLTIRCPRTKKLKVDTLCRQWESFSGLILEDANYSKMVIRDVNNYIAVYEGSSKTKHKGVFEIDKDWHKDHSMRIVRLALSEYYIKNTPVRDTIENHLNKAIYDSNENYGIYDFCKRYRATVGWKPVLLHINKDGKLSKDSLQKNVRYFISKEQNTLLKNHNDGRESHIEKNHTVTIFNKFKENTYKIDYNYYVHEANKIINTVSTGQLSLF